MEFRRLFIANRTAVLAAVLIAFATPASAQKCDINALVNAIGSISGPACGSAADDPGALTGAAAALGVFLAADQAAGTNFCNAAQNAYDNITSGQNQSQTIQNLLGPYGSVVGDLTSALTSVANPLATASCACSIDQGIAQLGNNGVACLQNAICGIQQSVLNEPCACIPPLPIANTNCTPPISCTFNAQSGSQPECTGALEEDTGVNPPSYKVTGQTVTDFTDGWNGSDKYCTAFSFCSCPSPMTLKEWPVNYLGGIVMFSCQCPAGTSLSTAPGPGAPLVCICDNTKQPALPANSPYGSCPDLTGPLCATGQVAVGNKCVTPCSNPSQIPLANGSCCDPKQASSCGLCCPSGQSPDPTTGNCTPASQHFTPIQVR